MDSPVYWCASQKGSWMGAISISLLPQPWYKRIGVYYLWDLSLCSAECWSIPAGWKASDPLDASWLQCSVRKAIQLTGMVALLVHDLWATACHVTSGAFVLVLASRIWPSIITKLWFGNLGFFSSISRFPVSFSQTCFSLVLFWGFF